ncbi:Uu.00g064260.m01.CDS01 [Anthostomella pinea]|uniref:Uu.00g064260.m01.CDS01 n=1 Tax=Anthostomella pinea TaxID=933095 RepID=A0AAI8VTI4_9PEZI|nr:Uu.00g064260.m01.CDS01 [Anthostomella pinea]
MAPGQKMYPRATVKKIVKAHSKCNVSKNVDVMVRMSFVPKSQVACMTRLTACNPTQIFLDYMLFMQTLMKEAAIDSKQAGERNISPKSDALSKFKG